MASLWNDAAEPDPHFPEQTACTHVVRWFEYHGFTKVLVFAEPQVFCTGDGTQNVLRHEQAACLYVHGTMLKYFAQNIQPYRTVASMLRGLRSSMNVQNVREIYTARTHSGVPNPRAIYLIENASLYMTCARARTPGSVHMRLVTTSGYGAF